MCSKPYNVFFTHFGINRLSFVFLYLSESDISRAEFTCSERPHE
jgi:hypothetical protein